MPTPSPEKGALNLLRNCAHAVAGDRLLIAYEQPEYGYFDAKAVEVVTHAAESIGLRVDSIDVGFNPDNPHLPADLLARIEAADITLFLARLGDQLRFTEMSQGKTIVVSFALTRELFGSGFANGHHAAFLDLKTAVNEALDRADHVRLTCPAGTEITGRPEMNLTPEGDTSILRFPMSVFTPVPAHSFTGRAAMTFLTGTGSKYYDDYSPEFSAPVFALMENGRLTGFEGDPKDVARANAQYDRVSGMFGIDRNFVHSWHAGIHPGCGYPWDMRQNYERWGGAAFGNPRILHFHTCGTYAPGEISWNIIDPTIKVDGVMLWEAGEFRADRLPGGSTILARYPDVAALFNEPDRDIGLREVE
ncbi:hypothetical protein [Yoonia sediminilitoris]|uniref:Uncharacterized protein n=1 Tax=Yoonia sediminilitoris TaxID=1286148 RepID=A0A2T6KB11_9RHOB|nr:hypothetical protein [Yoonia sediminilitoris]PUB12038.1 hypothetical protein C8N45_11115 [Yoonia sediminilitoris]RCW92865.1 hypothetical protein DFP92_11114 [Yoonia sediminilitoris]